MPGLGPIQKRVRRAFFAYPDRLYRTADLAAWCYPRLKGEPQRKHRWAIVRAARAVAERVGRDGRGVIFRAASDSHTEGQQRSNG